MTTATATRPVTDIRPAATTTVAIGDLRHAMRLAVAATANLSPDDLVWADLVPCMDELDQVLGQAIGRATSPTPGGGTHVPRFGALVIAARQLRGPDTTVVDAAAADRARQLAGVLARAGVTGIVEGRR